ncbi:MAG: thiamine phosphate synthase [Candidatus Binatia bacterium]
MTDRFMPSIQLPALYAILDPEQIRSQDPGVVLQLLLEGGAKIIQLRAKTLTPRDFFDLARAISKETRQRNCRFIVNDRVDIAVACGADGVHLGQEDLPLGAARKLMAEKIIGISTHSEEQARQAERDGADYIGFGPMFGTRTKETGYAARGTEMLRQIRSVVKIPIVAIGGIKEENVTQVWQAGADSAAIISDILAAEQITSKVERIARLSRALRQR